MNVYEGVDMAEVNRDLEDIARKEREVMTLEQFEEMINEMAAEYEAKQNAAASYDEDAIFYGVSR
jgi:hypothetical protein